MGHLSRAYRYVSPFSGLTKRCLAAKACDDLEKQVTLDIQETMKVKEGCPQPRVVIVGAGMAGLTAANRLLDCGISNFVILEASDRPGGRIQSCWLGDTVVELGAQHIEGGSICNPVFSLACQEGLISQPVSRFTDRPNVFLTSDGRTHTDFEMERLVFNHILNQAQHLFLKGSKKDKISLLHFLTLRVQQELLHLPASMRYVSERIFYGLLNSVKEKWGADLADLSAYQFGSFLPLPGGNVRIPLGFVGVLAPLLRNLSHCHIKYNKVVNYIEWNAEKSPRIYVKSTDGENFRADYLIMTASLGVLKERLDCMFSPKLPEFKKQAVDNLGYGLIDKVYLEYKSPWWSEKDTKLSLGWSLEELMDDMGWHTGISSLNVVPGSSHIIYFNVAGNQAKDLQGYSEDEIALEFTRFIRKYTRNPAIPYPCNIIVTRWTKNDFYKGSLSYMGMKSNVGLQVDLASPLPEKNPAPALFFAGEAATIKYFGTVHGARLTGIREANRIVDLTLKFGGPPTSSPC